MLGSKRVQSEFGVAANDHQEIVEVVSNPAGKVSYGIHFLRLPKLGFQIMALRDIAVVGNEMSNLAAAVADGSNGFFRVKEGSILFPVDEYTAKDFAGQDGVPKILVKGGILLPRLEQAGLVAQDFVRRIPGEILESRIHVFDCAVSIGDDDQVGTLFDSPR